MFGAKRLSVLLEKLRGRFALSDGAEITLETNPFSTPEREYEALLKAGINRLSFGVQSAVPAELRLVGRLQGPEQVRTALSRAKAAGFQNLSADLMLGIPGQTRESLSKSVSFLAELELRHVSAYLLKIEEGTPFATQGMAALCPGEDEQAELYLTAVSLLEQAGFRQYEISNFAVPGFESRHNLKYWRREEYLGFGPAAHSFFGGKRYAHPRDLEGYLRAGGRDAVLTDECPDPLEEELMLRLRLCEGVRIDSLSVGEAAGHRILTAARPLEQAGLLRIAGERISLTPEGFLVSNAVILRLIQALET